MSNKSNVKADFVLPIAVLTIICLVMAALLAFTNDVTAPMIEKINAERAEAARMEVLTEADGFTLLDFSKEELPGCVYEVYEATNGAGYVFMLMSDGYGGKETLSMICSIGADGLVVDSKTLSHNETPGLGTKVLVAPYRALYVGWDAGTVVDGMIISGSTITTSFYMNAIRDALAAYEFVKEAA